MRSWLLIFLSLVFGGVLLLGSRRAFAPGNKVAAEHGVLRFHLGRYQRLSGQPERAVETLQRALSNQPHPKIHTELGTTFLALGNSVSAAEHYVEALKLAPGDALAHSGLGSPAKKRITAVIQIGQPPFKAYDGINSPSNEPPPQNIDTGSISHV